VTDENIEDVTSSPARRSASECSHFRTRPSCWSYLAPKKNSRRHLKRFKGYRVDDQTHSHS